MQPDSVVMVANPLSHHPNDHTDAIAALDARDIAPYIATGRAPHPPRGRAYVAPPSAPPPADARLNVQMADPLHPELGPAIDSLRPGTVEPVLGLITDRLGFRQVSWRG